MKSLFTIPLVISGNLYMFSCTALVIVLFLILVCYMRKRPRYDYMQCTGYYERGDGTPGSPKARFRNNVDVRIDRKTGQYTFHSSNGRWYKLRKKHIDQIHETNSFDFPKKHFG